MRRRMTNSSCKNNASKRFSILPTKCLPRPQHQRSYQRGNARKILFLIFCSSAKLINKNNNSAPAFQRGTFNPGFPALIPERLPGPLLLRNDHQSVSAHHSCASTLIRNARQRGSSINSSQPTLRVLIRFKPQWLKLIIKAIAASGLSYRCP